MGVLQSSVDSWHVSEPAAQGALVALAAHLQREVLAGVRPPHGGAMDNCFHHCGQWGAIRWGGVSNADSFWRWYVARREQWRLGGVTMTIEAGNEGWPVVHGIQ